MHGVLRSHLLSDERQEEGFRLQTLLLFNCQWQLSLWKEQWHG